MEYLELSIILKFFFFFKIFKAFFSKPFPIITSKKNLFNLYAKFTLILKLHEIIPPNALIGSHDKAVSKLSILFLIIDTPQGFACLTITVPIFFGSVFEIDNAAKISL